jgi:hypothetical protein
MHRLIAERAGHHAIAATMTHMTHEAPSSNGSNPSDEPKPVAARPDPDGGGGNG